MGQRATKITTVLVVSLAFVWPLNAAAPKTGAEEAQTATAAAAAKNAEENARAAPRLVDAWPSIDALVADFVKALSQDDRLALLRLRVSEDEYRNLIVPGTVAPGQPPRRNTEKVKEFFWGMTDGKSRYYDQELRERFKGRNLKVRKLSFTRPTQHYAWYDAHGETRAVLEDEDGKNWDLETGCIVEVGGEFKFLSYDHD